MLASIALAAAAAPARAEVAAAPFDGSLQRLAEILGALHYLRNICGANEGLKWRNEMQALIDAEAPGGERARRMIASFNRGYRGYPADLPQLHAGGRPGHSPLPGGRLQDRPRDDGALRQLIAAVPPPRTGQSAFSARRAIRPMKPCSEISRRAVCACLSVRGYSTTKTGLPSAASIFSRLTLSWMLAARLRLPSDVFAVEQVFARERRRSRARNLVSERSCVAVLRDDQEVGALRLRSRRDPGHELDHVVAMAHLLELVDLVEVDAVEAGRENPVGIGRR